MRKLLLAALLLLFVPVLASAQGPRHQNLMVITNATSTQTSAVFTSPAASCAWFATNITSLTGTAPTLQLSVDGITDATGSVALAWAQDTLRSTAVRSNLLICPFNSTVPAQLVNGTALQIVMPRTFQLRMVTGGTVTDADYTIDVYWLRY